MGELEQLAGGVWWVCVCKLVVWPLAALVWIYLHLFRREAFGSYFAWMRKRGALPTYKLQSLDWGKGQDAPGMVGASVALHYAEHRAVDRHLVRRLCSAIRRGGGLLLNHKVRKIESHKVWVGERCFEAPQIISSLGAATCLLAPLPRLQRVAEAIGPSTSHAHLFLGLQCSRESIGMPEGVLWGEGPVFVSAHEGEGLGVSILTPVPPLGDEAWEREKPKWKKFLLGHFLKLFPGAKAEVCSLGGPRASFAYLGRRSSYGLKMCPRRFTWESVRALSPSTEIPGLYLTGQDILLPGFASQIATSMITCRALEGKTLLDTILGRDLMDRIPD